MADYIMGNNEVNALRIENTDRITIGFVTTGPIAISWGDGTTLNLSTQTSRYNASKLYSLVGNWNIVVTGAENVKEIYFDGFNYNGSNKINTSVIWFLQFVNLVNLYLHTYPTFNGDLGSVIESLPKFTKLTLYNVKYLATDFSFDISACKNFWKRCTYVLIYYSNCKGSLSDIDVNIDCEYFNIIALELNNSNQYVNGIIKNGYTKLTYFQIYVASAKFSNFQDFQDWVIPDTLLTIANVRGIVNVKNNPTPSNSNWGIINNFNFKNLTYFGCECYFSDADLSENQSFINFQNNCNTFSMSWCSSPNFKFDLSKFNRTLTPYGVINLPSSNNCYGDITNLLNKTLYSLVIKYDNNKTLITGQLPINFGSFTNTGVLILDNNSVSADATTIRAYLNRQTSDLIFSNLDNFSGDISGANFIIKTATNYYGLILKFLNNVYADITTFTWVGSNYANATCYCIIDFSYNPNFTGDLSNFPLWVNKFRIDLSNCAYTGIPGFVRKVFANRNTCLKAISGSTNIRIQNNIDNNLLTGAYQQPPLGTYAGNINDLTEQQIDYLAQGLDYTGTGTSTPWADKEMLWFMSNCKNSSTDSSLRYRSTWNF